VILLIATNSDETKHAKAFAIARSVLIAKTMRMSFVFGNKGKIGFV
jgi:hypothetical protein